VLAAVLNSFVGDTQLRVRLNGLHLSEFVIGELALFDGALTKEKVRAALAPAAAALNFHSPAYAPCRLVARERLAMMGVVFSHRVALAVHERLRLQCILDVAVAYFYGLSFDDLRWLLRECCYPLGMVTSKKFSQTLDPKGFWRVDKDKDPELRHTVLTLVAFHDLEEKIRVCGGDREKGIEAFLTQNDGEGWMLPETVRLSDYSLGHDERAKEQQPVAGRLGPRFYDWQLAQSPEESWRECHLHARNLLGEAGYQKLLADIEAGRIGERPLHVSEPSAPYISKKSPQGSFFE
jgi:hypothetical protein